MEGGWGGVRGMEGRKGREGAMDGGMEGGRASGREGRASGREGREGSVHFSVAMYNRLGVLGLMLCLCFLSLHNTVFPSFGCSYILIFPK